jgi:hypothetical protein
MRLPHTIPVVAVPGKCSSRSPARRMAWRDAGVSAQSPAASADGRSTSLFCRWFVSTNSETELTHLDILMCHSGVLPGAQ